MGGVLLGASVSQSCSGVQGKASNGVAAEAPLGAELDHQNQVRDHAADENDRPDKLLQQRLIFVG
jgi:hypothetical protein